MFACGEWDPVRSATAATCPATPCFAPDRETQLASRRRSAALAAAPSQTDPRDQRRGDFPASGSGLSDRDRGGGLRPAPHGVCRRTIGCIVVGRCIRAWFFTDHVIDGSRACSRASSLASSAGVASCGSNQMTSTSPRNRAVCRPCSRSQTALRTKPAPIQQSGSASDPTRFGIRDRTGSAARIARSACPATELLTSGAAKAPPRRAGVPCGSPEFARSRVGWMFCVRLGRLICAQTLCAMSSTCSGVQSLRW